MSLCHPYDYMYPCNFYQTLYAFNMIIMMSETKHNKDSTVTSIEKPTDGAHDNNTDGHNSSIAHKFEASLQQLRVFFMVILHHIMYYMAQQSFDKVSPSLMYSYAAAY